MSRRISQAQKSLVEIYKHEIKNCKPISLEEEQQLGLLILNGNPTAKEKLIKANLYFAWEEAKHYNFGTIPFEDLLEAANLGLCKAAERFDVRFGTRFLTYASHWINREIKELLRCERKSSCSLTADEEYKQYVSFDAIAEEGGSAFDSIMARDLVNMEDMYAFEFDSTHLYNALQSLTDDEFEIVTRYFGLLGKQPETMENIAKSFGISRQSINQRLNRIYKLIQTRIPSDFNTVA